MRILQASRHTCCCVSHVVVNVQGGLLRLWISTPDLRPQTPYIRQWRNGVRVASTVDRIVLY